MPTTRNKIRDAMLTFAPMRELLFFIYQKKVYKGRIDKKISSLLSGRKKLSDKRIDNLIISLTSFPQRIDEIKYTVYSLLDQTTLPEKIILWLAESQFPNKEQDLPNDLLAFRDFGLVINWCEDLKSYKKLIPALEQFRDYYIVTADDDLYYKRNWLEELWLEHMKYPEDLVCHYANKIRFKDKDILPYSQWEIDLRKSAAGFDIFCCSGGGVVFHQKYLHKDITRKDLYSTLAPHADDIWFYFMAVLNNTKIRIVKNPHKLKYTNPYREYGLNNEYRLSQVNVDDNHNDRQFNNVLSHYGHHAHALVARGEHSYQCTLNMPPRF